jgi:hypothetical protein
VAAVLRTTSSRLLETVNGSSGAAMRLRKRGDQTPTGSNAPACCLVAGTQLLPVGQMLSLRHR